jgi:[acyl-carrier-protein] S-malonyltransferase
MGRLILLCPGQGAQSAAMFDMARTDSGARALLDEWLPAPVDGAALFSNRVAQPAIVAATLAMWTALGELRPSLVAGYSIGELSAYAVAGALDPGDAVRLAGERARLMDACRVEGRPQALVALSGAGQDLPARFGFTAAIVNGEDSLVAGGPIDARDALVEAATQAGARAQVLPVEIASHTPYMTGAVAPFAALLQQQRWSAPAIPVLSGISGEPVERVDKAVEHLSRQLAETIRWKECMDACAEFGVTVALELGPGCALSRMLQARHPHIACRSASEFRSLDGIRAWLARQDL